MFIVLVYCLILLIQLQLPLQQGVSKLIILPSWLFIIDERSLYQLFANVT